MEHPRRWHGDSQNCTARRWLKASAAGHCGTTRSGVTFSCDTDLQGSWPLPRSATHSEAAATSECLARCTHCRNCHYVSIARAFGLQLVCRL